MSESAALAEALEKEHREIDDLFGRFLAAAEARDAAAAREAIERFDDSLRRHTEVEERRIYVPTAGSDASGRKLIAREGEASEERRSRELLLEHVQIREISEMMRRLLADKNDLAGARSLAGNLARRWDAHTTREEREVFSALRSG